MGGAQGTTFLGWNYVSSAGVPDWTLRGAADFNADGFPDLLVHMGTNARSDPTQPGNKQLMRVLMNRAKDGGGRHFVDVTVDSHYGRLARTFGH